MTSPVVALIAFVVFVVSFVPLAKWFIRRQQFIAALERIPGPKAYPLIGNAYMFFGRDRESFNELNLQLFKQFPVIQCDWMGPLGQVVIRRSEHVEQIISSGKSNLEKAWTYVFVRPWLGEGLLLSHGEKWHQRRKMITPAFHFSILESFVEVMVEKSQVLVEKLVPNAASGEPFQIYPFITRAAMDIIAEAAMGTVINAQDNNAGNKYMDAVYSATELIILRIIKPWNHVDFIYKHTSDGKKFAQCLTTLHSFTNEVIATRKANRATKDRRNDVMAKKQRPAFLDLLLDLSSDSSETLLTDGDIREEVDTFMFEGHDTTTSGISWAIYHLGRHPQIQEDVFAELKSIFGQSGRPATIADLNEMHLLDRVIKETLRLYPSVPIIGRKASEDIQLDSQYRIPKGCDINIDITTLHRDPRYFPDPERFDPDRFLPENTQGRHPFAYIPFSAGSRNCIGQKFAVYEEKVMLSTLVRNYRFKSVGKDEIPVPELITKPLYGVLLVMEHRG